MGGILPAALLCASLGLALASVTKRTLVLAFVMLGLVASLVVLIGVPADWKQVALWGCWFSVIITALCVQLPWQLPLWFVIILAANTGIWSGAIIALTGQPIDLAKALAWVFIALPAAWLMATPARLGVKIAAGWLVAIAILGASVGLVTTPGYEADHVE